MGAIRTCKTEHAGDKGMTRSSGFYGTREEAKTISKIARRRRGKQEIRERLNEYLEEHGGRKVSTEER